MIGVVIPFFQRTPGLLRRALLSVATQSIIRAERVFVVDDGSPASPGPELAGLPEAFAARVTVLRQANAGPGAARNLALDRADRSITAIAFLDSDDVWTPGHLARAEAALTAGADFYFAEHKRCDATLPRFAECGFAPDGAPIAGVAGASWCRAASVSGAIIRRSPVGTSTVVIRREKIGARRFPVTHRAAGEDTLFWLDVLNQDLRAACGTERAADYGNGVSIFNTRSWGDARSMIKILDEMRTHHHVRRRFRLEPDLDTFSRSHLRALDVSLCAGLLACARRGRVDAAGPALRYLYARPWALTQMLRVMREAVRAHSRQPMQAAPPTPSAAGDRAA